MNNLQYIYLNRNEYFFPHPPEVNQTLQSPYEENFISHYAKTAELNQLQLALAQIYNVDCQSVLLGHGAEDIFVKLLSWFRKEKSQIVIEDFSWANYLHIAGGFHYDVIPVQTLELKSTFAFNFKGFYETLNKINSAIVFLTSPNNPTGHTVNLIKFHKLCQAFPQHLFILDSVYNEINNIEYAKLFQLTNCIFVGSFSKFFGMPGLRLGYAIGNGNLPTAFQLNLGLQPTTIYAALAALKNINYYQKNREYMLSFSKNLLNISNSNFKIYETHAPFFLAKINNNLTDFKLAETQSGIIPKYIFKDKCCYLRFGLGPKEICEKINVYFENLL